MFLLKAISWLNNLLHLATKEDVFTHNLAEVVKLMASYTEMETTANVREKFNFYQLCLAF